MSVCVRSLIIEQDTGSDIYQIIVRILIIRVCVCVSALHDASRRLQDCLADMYEPEWFGKEEMDTMVEVRTGNDRT